MTGPVNIEVDIMMFFYKLVAPLTWHIFFMFRRWESLGIGAKPRAVFFGPPSSRNSLQLLHFRSIAKKLDNESSRYHKTPHNVFASGNHLSDTEAQITEVTRALSSITVGANGYWCDENDIELAAFADWAFSRNGLPHLKVLAAGDFSYGNRFLHTHRLICRNNLVSEGAKAWRPVKSSDAAEGELIFANMDMLSACPATPFFNH